MTISQNKTLSFGGGVYSSATTSIVETEIRTNNSLKQGAGVYNSGVMVITDTEIVGNIAESGGGGLHNFRSGEVTIRHSSFTSNQASGGGGISNTGTMTVHKVTVGNNVAGSGGGIGNSGSLAIDHTTISGNRISSAGEGAGILHNFDTPEMMISKSTIAFNTGGAGTGIFYYSSIVMNNSIVIGNVGSQGEMRDLEETSIFPFGGDVIGSNNLIGNPATSGDLVHGIDGNVVGQSDGNGGREGVDVATAIAPLADNGGTTFTHALVSGSPAIDAGDPNFNPSSSDPPITTDQRGDGFDRVIDGNGDGIARIDIGAFESPVLPNILVTETGDVTVVNEAGTDTVNVSLSRQPLQPVVVDVSIGTPSVISSDATQLTFTPENWDKAQQITLSGVQDDDETGPLATSVVLTVNDAESDDDFDGLTTTVDVAFQDDDGSLRGNVDGDADFDANDAFLIHLVQLSGANIQIDQAKGASPLSAAEIRSAIDGLLADADVDGDGDTDANDSFIIQLVKLSGSNAQIDQSKGASSLTAEQIRANVEALGGNQGASVRNVASASSVLAAVASTGSDLDRLFEAVRHDVVDEFTDDSNASQAEMRPTEYRNWLSVIGT